MRINTTHGPKVIIGCRKNGSNKRIRHARNVAIKICHRQIFFTNIDLCLSLMCSFFYLFVYRSFFCLMLRYVMVLCEGECFIIRKSHEYQPIQTHETIELTTFWLCPSRKEKKRYFGMWKQLRSRENFMFQSLFIMPIPNYNYNSSNRNNGAATKQKSNLLGHLLNHKIICDESYSKHE